MVKEDRMQADAIRRALDEYMAIANKFLSPCMMGIKEARAQLDALLAENERLRARCEKLTEALWHAHEDISSDEKLAPYWKVELGRWKALVGEGP